jgi:uncharacterized repeat protein (TIGR01451 family)
LQHEEPIVRQHFSTATAVRRSNPGIPARLCAVLRLFAGTLTTECDHTCSKSGKAGRPGPFSFISRSLSLILFFLFFSSAGWAVTPAGTVISNTATARYSPGAAGSPVMVTSNTATVTTTVRRTPSVLEILQYAPTAPTAVPTVVSPTDYSTSGTSGGPFAALPPPVQFPSGTPINLGVPVPLVADSLYHAGEPVFIRLTDLDQNLDPAVIETVLVTIRDNMTSDVEVLRLRETGPNTGVFTGYVPTNGQSPASGNGILNVINSSRIIGSYVDVMDVTDTRTTAVFVDPFGMVFSSATGAPVDGAQVSMVNALTGLPATIYGDDGVSSFPATVTSGGTAADSSGQTYTFSPGGYRFPFISPGTYRIVVVPPAGYRAPSTVPTADLQALPGGPFAIVAPGSRAEDFIVNPGPAIHIDIPVDATGSRLYLTKTAVKPMAAIGDFVPYQLLAENTDPLSPVLNVVINDRLPAGFRYRRGSARVNSAAAADPSISADGRTLSFSLGNMAAGAKVAVSYVAEVGAGARPGKARNTAVATGAGGAVSNSAFAEVLVMEDLYRSTATIVGQIIVDGCGDKERSEEAGLAGIRIFREDGAFAVTDKNGMYHFPAVKPGTHVVQLDLQTIPERYEVMACEENTRFAGSATSQFVDLQGGTLWRADFHLGLKPKQVGEVGIEITTTPKKPGAGGPVAGPGKDLVEYSIPMHVGVVPARNLRLSIMLPEGATYRKGSTTFTGRTIDGAGRSAGTMTAPTGTVSPLIPLDEPQETEGSVTFRFAEVPANWEGKLTFDAVVPVAGPEGRQLPTRAVLTSDSPEGKNNRTPVVNTALVLGTREELQSTPDIVLHPRFASGSADLTRQDKEELDRLVARLKKVRPEHITVTGHTDSQRISRRLQERYPDNYALSYERAATIGAYLAEGLHLSLDQVIYEGKGPDAPVASNATQDGRARNRRVELKVRPPLQLVSVPALMCGPPSGMKAVATLGLRPGEVWQQDRKAEEQKNADRKKMPDYNTAWLQTAGAGFAWLWPPERFYPSAPITGAAIKHDPAHTLALSLNGEVVDPIAFEGTLKREDGGLAVSTWSGLHLVEGDNRIEAVVKDDAGKVVERSVRVVHYSGNPVQAVFVPERSRLVADGQNPPVIAMRLLDKDGHPAREGIFGEFSVDPPHLPRKRVEELQQSPLIASTSDRVRYTVGDDGIALIELEPTTQTGEAVIRLPLSNESRDIRAWLTSEDRDWILVGLAEGTFGYNTVKGNMETFGAGGGEDGFTDDSRVAFYAKGRIKGEWLLTVAYDSARRQGRDPQGLFQTIDPNKYYLLYGDGTETRYDAASAKSLYVKIERGQFYALFGDYSTGMTVTELSRYSRSFTGFKSEMKGDWYEYNIFAAETNQAFIKDEIPGDGTSGLYRLSRRNILLGSERVTIEVRDRFHSEVIVSSQQLSRFLDYTIDYEAGTIFFKQPIFNRDGNFNPIYIVAEYESFDAADSSMTYGGRGAVKLLRNKVEVGATHVHEGRVGGSGNLEGADAAVDLGGGTKLRAEVATTRTEQLGAETAGSAYLAEVAHRSTNLEGRAYVREQDAGFGLGQQNGSETGTRKMGMDLNYRLSGPWSAGGEVFRQETLGTGAIRDVAEVRGRYAAAQYEFLAGLRHAEDTFTGSEAQRSEQVYFGARYQLNERTSLRFKHEQSVGGFNANGDYPTRTTLGADYKLSSTATLYADQEWTSGSNQDSTTSRVGIKAAPWTGGQISSTMEQQVTENGVRLFSTTGLKQSWQVDKNWSMDAGLDRSTTYRHPGDTPLNVNVPPASGGTEDFTAVSLGAGYRQEKWSWTGRVEHRISDSEEKNGLMMGANGEPRPGVGLAAGLLYFASDANTGREQRSGDVRFGLAYRPRETRWIVLDRLDYLVNEQKGGGSDYNSQRFVNNVVANYASGKRVQVSLQYGAKYVLETIDAADYRGYTDLTGIELRYDLTKRWDVGVRVSALHSWSIGQVDYGTSVSTGFNLGKNFWISVGYNITGFKDRDFSRADFTSEGPFIKFRFKFDQMTARDAVKWFSGQ